MGELLTLHQVAEQLHASISSVRAWAKFGFNGVLLQTTRAGRRKLVKPEWIDEFNRNCDRQKEVTKAIASSSSSPKRKAKKETTKALRRHRVKG